MGETDLKVPEDLSIQLQQQRWVSELVGQVNYQIRSALALDDVLTFTSQLLAEQLDCDRVRILVSEPGNREMFLVRSTSSRNEHCLSEFYKGQQVEKLSATPLSIEKSTYLQALTTPSSTATNLFAITTCYQGQINGVLELYRPDFHSDWCSWERQLVEEVGNQLAVVINQFHFQVEMERQVERESLLRLVTNHIRSSLDFDNILQTIVHEVRQLLNTDRVVIYQFVEGWQGKVVVEDVINPWDSVLGAIGQDDCFATQYAVLYQGGRVRAINNIHEAGLDECHVRFLQRMQVQANLVVPILQNSPNLNSSPVPNTELWGLLIAHECRSPRYWQSWETALLKQLGDQIAIALQQAQLYTQVRQAAIDSQTQTVELQALLAELRATQAQLIQTEKLSSLGQMVAGVAHEINNATNFIHANLPYVQEYATVTEQVIDFYAEQCPGLEEAIANLHPEWDLNFIRADFSKLIHSMQNGTERIREIVHTLRNFSRLDEAIYKAVDLHEGIESSLVLLKHRIAPTLKVHKDYGVLPLVECHAGQINQVFLNLLNNALDAMEDQGELMIRTWQSADNTVILSIRDSGTGILPEVQARMFDPFFTTKPVGKGTGLGLSICHQIVVSGHKGQIRCSSHPGQGAEFQVELPICQGGEHYS